MKASLSVQPELENVNDAIVIKPYQSGDWIAWKNNQPVGHVGAQDMGDYIELRRMYVRKMYRRAGIGTQLVGMLIDHCRQHGIRFIKLWTDPDGPGRLLYKNFYFQEVENAIGIGDLVHDHRGEIRMVLSL
ncbi:MAG: GNAT family N-acetyltransferase [Anaerolineales bacterium]